MDRNEGNLGKTMEILNETLGDVYLINDLLYLKRKCWKNIITLWVVVINDESVYAESLTVIEIWLNTSQFFLSLETEWNVTPPHLIYIFFVHIIHCKVNYRSTLEPLRRLMRFKILTVFIISLCRAMNVLRRIIIKWYLPM